MLYDVIVVGLGPGGATSAYELASKGLTVLAFDKEKFPRYKPCGGCLSLKVEKILPFDFKHVVEDTAYGAVFTFKFKRPLPILSGQPVGYNVNRDRFDNLLKEKAQEAGAVVRTEERVLEIAEETDFINVKTSEGTYRAKVLIGADGANSIVGRGILGLSPKKCAVAIEAELPLHEEKLALLKGKLLIDFGSVPHGYAWVFPKGKNISAGIAGLSKKVKGKIKEYFRNFANKEKSLYGLDIDNVHGWTIPYYYDASLKIAKGRILAVGDAAHLVDPFLGEGIYYAIRSGQMAAKVISERIGDDFIDISDYNDIVAAELYPELKAAAKLSRLIYNFPGLWYNILENEPVLMEDYYDVVRGKTRYEIFYGALMSRIMARPWKLLTGRFKRH